MATREQLIEDFADHKYATGEKFERLINSMKVVQEPVTDPAASGTSLSFIDSIEQDEDGKITATKKTLDLSNVHELNPFKGWWKTGDTLPTSGFDGAYLYFKDTTQTPAVTTIYRWNGTAYADTGTVVDESNVQTFASGQQVNTVHIKDENGEEVSGPAGVLSAEAGVKLNKKLNPTELSTPTYVAGIAFNSNSDGFESNSSSKTAYLHLDAGESFKVVLKETIAISRWRFGVTAEPPAVSVTATNGAMKDNPAVGDTIFEYMATVECYVCVSTSAAYINECEFYITKDAIKDIQDSINTINGNITTLEGEVEDLNEKTNILIRSTPSSVSNMTFNTESNGFVSNYSGKTAYLHLKAGESCKVIKTVENGGWWRFGVTTEIPSLNTTATNGGLKTEPAVGDTIFEYTATSECYVCVSVSVNYINECEFYITKSISDSIKDIQDDLEDIQNSVTTLDSEVEELNDKLNLSTLVTPSYANNIGLNSDSNGFVSNSSAKTAYIHLKAGESCKVVKTVENGGWWRFGVTTEIPSLNTTATNGGLKTEPAVGDTIFEYTVEEDCYVCVSVSVIHINNCEFYITKSISDSIKDIQDSVTTLEDTVEDLNGKTNILIRSTPTYVAGIAFNSNSDGFESNSSSKTAYLHLNAGESCRVVLKETIAISRWRFGVTAEIPSLNTTATNGGMKDNPTIGSTIFEYTAEEDCYVCVSTAVAHIGKCKFYYSKSISDGIEDIQDTIEDIQDSVTTKEQEIQNRFTNILFANDTNPTKCLTLLHFSDIHGNTANLRRIVAFKNKWSENIDDVICTGDLVSDTFSNTFIFDDSVVEGSEDILLCIGNHDTAYGSPKDWYHYAGTQDAYNRYMANVSQWGVTQPTGAGADSYYPCYYYKDYTDKNVRLIVLDMMAWGNDIANGVSDENNVQSIWLNSVLTSAKTTGLHVVIAEHFPHFAETNGVSYPKTADVIDSDFSLPNRFPKYIGGYDREVGGAALGVISAKIESFITAGGKFVCWICGHTHFDVFEKVIGTEQKVVVISTASAANDTRTIRNSANDSIDLFNIFSVDTTNRIVKVFRIGGHLTPALQKIDTMHFTY